MAKPSDVWVLVEHRDGEPGPSSLEAAGVGRTVARRLSERCVAVVVEVEEPDSAVAALSRAGADTVLAVTPEPTVVRSPEGFAAVLEAIAVEGEPRVLVAPGTTVMTEVATRLAVRRGWPIVPDCVALRVGKKGRVVVHRPGPTDEYTIRARLRDFPAAILVEPGAFAARSDRGAEADIERITVEWQGPDDVEVVGVEEEDRRTFPLAHAKVIVAGGAGVGGPDGFDLIGALADALGGTVGASRGATERGWIARDRLIGHPGAIVRPDLYIGCGISGDGEHVTGIRRAGTVVTINTDPDAPINAIADVAAVGDLHAIVPNLVDDLVEGGL